MFSTRIMVALDTGQGVVYAPAFGWDRVYLLWTFRNFRSLPQNVLSPRQQQLMGSLYREASNRPAHELDPVIVVGTVEGFNPSTLRISGAFLGLFSRIPANDPVDTCVPERKPFYARLAFVRPPLKWLTLKTGTGALAIVIAILAWHELKAQPIRSTPSDSNLSDSRPLDLRAESVPHDSKLVVAEAASAAAVENLPMNPAPTETSAAAVISSEAEAPNPAPPQLSTLAAAPSVSIAASPLRAIAAAALPARRQAPAVSSSVETDDSVEEFRATSTDQSLPSSSNLSLAAADQPRVKISGRPQKLVYPVCPETRARGKVSLQAVVAHDGSVNRVRVLTGDRILAAAAVEAVRQWRYQPFSDAAIERETNITISFISNEVVAVSFPGSSPFSR